MGMARKCCVKNCDSDGQESLARLKGLPLHKFPKDAALRTRWLASGAFEPGFRPTTGQFVCHRHFRRADYETIKGHKFVLRKGSVPTVFDDYDNHPDPLTMPVKTNTSYPQEDLDLINSEILNMDSAAAESPLFAEARTPRSDSCGEACNSRPGSSADSFNPFESSDVTEIPECRENEDATMGNEDSVPEKPDEHETGTAHPTNPQEAAPATRMDEATDDASVNKEDHREAVKTEDEKTPEKPAEAAAPAKPASRGSLKFFAGARLEAKDFNDKWYSARVVETDWVDREVLIHFDKWSSRFDEWIPMDSSRLRVLQMQPRETKMRDFSVGERILATWADGRKYPAKVNAVLGNDRYDVLFDDGYAKIVRSSKMTKIASTSEKKAMEGDSYIGSKQERRDKKRKHTVMELFQTHPRKRNKTETEKSLKKEEIGTSEEPNNCHLDSSTELDNSTLGTYYDSGAELLRGFENAKPKMKTYTKKMKREAHRNDTDQEDDVGPEWIDGEPQGIETYIVDGNDVVGSRRSIIVADRRLPPIWQKHFTQRKAGTSAGKWDVLFVHKPSGKKFRSRNDIRAFMESQGQFDFDPEMFDFCIHRRKSKNSISRLKSETPGEPAKKIKTLLPKTKAMPLTPENSLLVAPTPPEVSIPITPTTTPVEDGAVFIGGLRVEMEDSAYKCPKDGCCKNFRKENLLQMHIKHYHPEYSKFLGSTPNVADLAYARTIGESIVDVTPKKSGNHYLEKISKFEKRKAAAHEKPIASAAALIASSGATIPLLATSPLPSNNQIPPGSEIIAQEKLTSLTLRDDSKFELMSPISNASMDIDEELATKKPGDQASCAMSPGALFDLKIREEKTQVGIKTLLPVRPPHAPTTDASRLDRSKSLDEATNTEKGKVHRKRQLSEYSSELARCKGRQGMQELTDDYGDLDDSTLDAEGPAGLMYRFSRRKSDAKSDENSQSSQLNDSRLEKADTPKGDAAKSDISNEGNGVMVMINGEMIKLEQLRREEIINCTCGFMEEDGLMIQCDLCLCWQHGHCNAIEREKDVPEKYICYICRHPYRQRPSMKYLHDQEWIKDGKLPSLSERTKDQTAINQRTAMLKRTYDLVAALLEIQQILHSLRVKISVAQQKDHPKLYLWAKNWEKSEIPEPTVEPVPVMRLVKPEVKTPEPGVVAIVEPKIETTAATKEEPDERSIASDTELMKILEEDSTPMDDSRGTCKKEDPGNSTGDHILLDALTKNDNTDEMLNISSTVEVKTEDGESINDASAVKMSTDVETPEATTPAESSVPSVPPREVPVAPLQPFIPEPEAPIDPAECRQRLLEHIDHFQNHIDSRLTTIEAQVDVLEAMDPKVLPSSDVQRRTKQTVQMLLRDLSTVRKLAALC